MLQRIAILLKLFFCTMLFFVLQKPMFMLYNKAADASVTAADCFDVLLHGIPLDLTVAGYVLVVPLLLIAASFFHDRATLTKRVLIAYFVIISILVSIVFVADTVMYDFWQFKLDSSVFLYTDKPADAVASVSTTFLVLCGVAFVVHCALMICAYVLCIRKAKLDPVLHSALSIIMIPLMGLCFLMIRGGVGAGTANVSRVYYSEKQFLNHSAVNPVFNFLYSLGKTQDFTNEFHYYESDECQRTSKDLFTVADTTLTERILTTQRPNILYIVWEGCPEKCVEAIGGERGITPHLNRLATEGVSFTHCYASSFRTDRGLVSIMSGWLGMPTASLMKIPKKCENLPALPRTLRSAGYLTDFWYGGDITFTNMNGYMLQAGFQSTVSDVDFSVSDRSYSKWGVRDDVLLNRLADDLCNRSNNGQYTSHPYFTAVLTLSSHEPWEVPERRLDEMKRNAFAYTDECIGRLIDRLKRSDQWDNLLIIISSDHGIRVDETDALTDPSFCHIPLVFTGGAAIGFKHIDTIMSQSDIAATLLAQLGLPHDDFIFSRNVLARGYNRPFAFHTSSDYVMYIDTTGVTTFDHNVSKTVYSEGEGNDKREGKAKTILQALYEEVGKR
ncbi:MAG: sulfatase-like hydrolase/transferase [Bacteroidaceae bacterium]|nr:sulfatase-like hydrolase/transferase [Bacteroidaceae bacterium]